MAGIIFPNDIRQQQADLRAQAQELNAVRDAHTDWTADTVFDAEWRGFMIKVAHFCALDVGFTNTTGNLYNEGEALKAEMNEWHKRIAARWTKDAPPRPADTPKTLLEAATHNAAPTLVVAGCAVAGVALVIAIAKLKS